MESKIAFNKGLSSESPPEPHFDEEATLLSARPVVPLHEANAGARSMGRLTFGLTIIASLVVGALGATLIYKRGQKPTATVETSSPVSGQPLQEAPMSEATGAASGAHETATPDSGKPDEEATDQARTARASEPSKKLAGPVFQIGEPGRDERETRRFQRMEARRLRRKAERQAMREALQKHQSSDDLLRIREIFEGSPRP